MSITPEELCARYADKVARFASFATGRDADAEDVAQDSLMKAIAGLHRYDATRGSLDAWLWRIVVNTARDATRRARVRAAVAERLGREISYGSVEEEAIDRASSAEVYTAMARLAPRDRELLALRFGADMSTADVGGVVGLEAESARRAIGRALGRLRTILAGGVR